MLIRMERRTSTAARVAREPRGGRTKRERRPPGAEGLGSILVATDFSRDARHALERALRLHLAPRAVVRLVHVLPDGMPEQVRALAEREAMSALAVAAAEATRAAAAEGLPARRIEAVLAIGRPWAEIARLARRHGVDLVVLGRHGKRAIRDLAIGTTAERIVREVDASVLVTSSRPPRASPRPIAALDLDETGGAVLDLARRALGPAASALSVVHAFEIPFERFVAPTMKPSEGRAYRSAFHRDAATGVAKLLEAWEGSGERRPKAIRCGDARQVILREALRRRADLIAVGSRAGASHAPLGSVAECILRAAPCDVLVARGGAAEMAAPA